jgi:tetratricopeptide (TPR) repeat protein
MMVSFNLIHSLFGLNPTAFHLFQIGLHLASACLVYLLAKRFLPISLAWFGSVIFMVHPINVEAVVYSSNLQDVLLTFFGLLSLHLSLKPMKGKIQPLLPIVWLLTLFSKESGIIYIILSLFLIRTYQPKKIFTSTTTIALIVTIFYLIIRFQAVGFPTSDPVVPIVSTSTYERLLTVPKVITTYLFMYSLPVNLHTGQNWVITSPSFTHFYLPLLIVILGSLALVKIWTTAKKSPTKHWQRFLILWFVANLILHSQLIPLDATVADRWFYGSSIAATLLLLLKLSHHLSTKKQLHLIFNVLGIIVIGLSLLTLNRIKDWQSPFRLLSKDYARSAPSYNLANNLGIIYFQAGDTDTAIDYLNASIDHVPNWGVSWTNLGVAKEAQAKTNPSKAQDYYQQAIAAYRQAIIHHAGVNPYVNLARLLVETQIESDQTTTSFLTQSTKRYPDNPDLWFLLSQWELAQNRFDSAYLAASAFHQLLNTPQSFTWLQTVEQAKKDFKATD